MYWGLGALYTRSTSRAAKKGNWGIKILAGSNRKPQICSFCEACTHTFVFKFVENMLNSWKHATGKNHSSWWVQRVIEVQLSWLTMNWDWGEDAVRFFYFRQREGGSELKYYVKQLKNWYKLVFYLLYSVLHNFF